jgi:hypothetical protein
MYKGDGDGFFVLTILIMFFIVFSGLASAVAQNPIALLASNAVATSVLLVTVSFEASRRKPAIKKQGMSG